MEKYSRPEIDDMLDSMFILIDTREQKTRRYFKRIAEFSVPNLRMKLDFGDYSCGYINSDGERIRCDAFVAVERKMNLDELCNCFGKERKRFEREFLRAKDKGAKMHLIIENGSYEDMFDGNYRSELAPNALIASYLAWAERYDIQLHFCKPETTGRLIEKILHYWLKARLEKLQEGDFEGERCDYTDADDD